MSKLTRGHKECIKCHAHVGVRTKKCKCGFDFYSDEYKNRKPRDEWEEQDDEQLVKCICLFVGTTKLRKVYACATEGDRLKLTGYEDVYNFVTDLLNEAADNGQLLMPSAVKGVIRHRVGPDDALFSYVDTAYEEIKNQCLNI